jgi:3-hydroxyacyl-[acyl-carrier-protein] dehydratase
MSQQSGAIQALSSLPHGPEFRFIDDLLELSPGEHGTGRWTLKGTEEFLRGHFPGQPMLPGVIMAEALAQLAGVVVQSARAVPLRDMRLTAIRQFKILGTLSAGEAMTITAKVEGIMGGLIQASGSITASDGRVLATGAIVLTGQEEPVAP